MSPSILGRIHICAVLDLDRLVLRLDETPELPLKVILDRELLVELVLGAFDVHGASFALVEWHRMLLQPLPFKGVGSPPERVKAVLLALVESVVGAVEEETGVAEELRGGDFLKRRREAVEVVAAIAAVAENDLVRVVVLGANLADLQESQSQLTS